MRAGAVLVLAGIAGFSFGLLWGKGTRTGVANNVKTDVSGGVITVQVDAQKSLLEGLQKIL